MNPAFKDLVNEFLADLLNAGKSRHTIRNYRSNLYRFAEFYGGEVEALTAGHLREYLLTQADKAPSTRARNFASLNKFLD